MQVHCSADSWSTWQFAQSPFDPNGFQLRQNSGFLCLTAANNSGANHTPIVVSHCDYSTTFNNTVQLQTWYLG